MNNILSSFAILNAKVLIVDDQEANILLLRRLLAGAGYTSVESTSNPLEVCELHRKNRYDLILLDLRMPGMDGFQVMEGLKEIESDGYIPVLVITAQPEHKLRALETGAMDFVAQPINLAEVLLRVYNMLEVRLLHLAGKREAEQAEARGEQANCASELRFQRLFETAKDGILILDVDSGRINDANPFLLGQLGFSRNEVIGKTVEELDSLDGPLLHGDLPMEAREGRRITIDFASQVYQSGDRNLIQCNVRDLAKHEQAEEEIGVLKAALEQCRVKTHTLEGKCIEAQKMEVLGQLAGGVAHDFNNILAVIMGYSDLITSQLGTDSPLGKLAGEIQHASERAAGLTRQLLVFSRKQTVQPVVLNLNDVVQDLKKMLRRLIAENIEMTVVPGQQTGRVKADPGHIGQVLMNLVINARDAMPIGGKLTIATHNVTLDENYARLHAGVTPGDYVMLSVSDTGVGIVAEVKARLFEPFFTTKALGKGTGLGLAICQTIVQQSGGHISVYSEVGKGTTFKTYFPRIDQTLAAATKPVQTEPLSRGTETLLVVEDESSLRKLAAAVLEAQGYTVLRASNGQDGLQMAREHKTSGSPIRLVVTDVVMPLMGGKAMAEWLKATYPDLKVLFTSGYTDDALAQQGVLEGGVDFLPKPYTSAALLLKVRALLDKQDEPATTQDIAALEQAGDASQLSVSAVKSSEELTALAGVELDLSGRTTVLSHSTFVKSTSSTAPW